MSHERFRRIRIMNATLGTTAMLGAVALAVGTVGSDSGYSANNQDAPESVHTLVIPTPTPEPEPKHLDTSGQPEEFPTGIVIMLGAAVVLGPVMAKGARNWITRSYRNDYLRARDWRNALPEPIPESHIQRLKSDKFRDFVNSDESIKMRQLDKYPFIKPGRNRNGW